MSITAAGHLLAVDNQSNSVFHYAFNGNKYHFRLVCKFGESCLRDPLDVAQMRDGRVVVTDGKGGHSVKVRMTLGQGEDDTRSR